jgi:catechol 2,3-dioxygenase-like lactoylglutathione lyase family enzyme
MTVKLAKSAIDLGIVVSESARSLAFYCELLGLEHVADMPMPIVTNLDEILAACTDAGVPILVPATIIGEGTRIGMVTDPDGNWVEFVEST